MRIEPVEVAGLVYYVLSDEAGYPLAQGSRELCERSMESEMARPKGSSNKKKTGDMQAALDFVACAVTEHTNEHWRASLQFRDGFMLAFDGVISAGVKVSEEFTACPHYGQLKRVVERAALDGANFTQLDPSKLAVTSGKFKAVIQCLDPTIMQPVAPDPNIAKVGDVLRTGFELIGPIVKENGQTVVEASLLLQAQTMAACDRVVMAEYWHGYDLPPEPMILPKRFISAIVGTKKTIVGFGYNPGQTMTLHFEDGSWIKTQLFSERWPESWAGVLNKAPADLVAPIPEGFFEAIAAVTPFSDDGAIYFDGTAIRSHDAPGVGASYDFACPSGFSYAGGKLQLMKGRAETLFFSAEDRCAYFFSNDPPIRSAVASRIRSRGQDIQPDSQVQVPAQFQPPAQQPPQEAQGQPLAGAVADIPAGWQNPFQPHATTEGDGFAADPADAWRAHSEAGAHMASLVGENKDGWGTTRSDVPMPEGE